MKRLTLILFALLLIGADECNQPVPLPPPGPEPGESPYCYGEYTTWMTVKNGVSGAINALYGGEESVDRRATLRIAMENSRCTGVAVGPQTALTAAHCVRNATQATAALGGYSTPPYWDMSGKDVHPDTDLAVVWYSNGSREEGKPLEEPYVSDIFDPLNPQHASKCVRFIAQGWGRWEQSALSLRECTYAIDEIAWDGELYVRKHGPEECRICFGDSGGGLYAEMSDGSLMLAGITRNTWGDCTIQSGHNALQPYRDWFEERVR